MGTRIHADGPGARSSVPWRRRRGISGSARPARRPMTSRTIWRGNSERSIICRRVGSAWNVVVESMNDGEALNFGVRRSRLSHDQRYDRAEEFMELILKLWDSWDEGALRLDRAGRHLCRSGKVHYVRSRWDLLQVAWSAEYPPWPARTSGDHPGRRVRSRTSLRGEMGGNHFQHFAHPRTT